MFSLYNVQNCQNCHNVVKILAIKKDLYFSHSIFFMLYENIYHMVFTCHLAGKIWPSICMQDTVKPALHYQMATSKTRTRTLKNLDPF